MKKQENNQDMESTKKSFLSMGFSLALVICVLLFIFGFKHFLKGREYQGNAVQKEAESSTQDIHKEYLDTDKTFQSGYIMIKDVPGKGIYTSKLPGEKKKKDAVSLKNGQILWASKKGSYEGKTYYHLRNGMYLRASEKYTEDQKQTALVVRSVAFTAVCCIMNSAMRTFLNVIRQYSIPFCILHIGKLWQIISGVSKSDGA